MTTSPLSSMSPSRTASSDSDSISIGSSGESASGAGRSSAGAGSGHSSARSAALLEQSMQAIHNRIGRDDRKLLVRDVEPGRCIGADYNDHRFPCPAICDDAQSGPSATSSDFD